MPAEVWVYGTILIISLAILAYQWWIGILTWEYWLASVQELGGPWVVTLLTAFLVLAVNMFPDVLVLILIIGTLLRWLIEFFR